MLDLKFPVLSFIYVATFLLSSGFLTLLSKYVSYYTGSYVYSCDSYSTVAN